jgi:hypothetical protein
MEEGAAAPFFVMEREENNTKRCSKCGDLLYFTQFSSDKRHKDGLQSSCKKCRQLYYKKNRDVILEKQRRSRATPEDKQKRRIYLDKNRDKIKNQKKKAKALWDLNNKDHIAEYEEKNKDVFRKRRSDYWRRRRLSDVSVKIRSNLSRRIRCSLSEYRLRKKDKTVDLLGCSMSFFCEYIESLFLDGMSWYNYGNKRDNWELDHIIPCDSFNMEDDTELRKCFHYTNVRPLWVSENRKKSNKLIYENTSTPHLS